MRLTHQDKKRKEKQNLLSLRFQTRLIKVNVKVSRI